MNVAPIHTDIHGASVPTTTTDPHIHSSHTHTHTGHTHTHTHTLSAHTVHMQPAQAPWAKLTRIALHSAPCPAREGHLHPPSPRRWLCQLQQQQQQRRQNKSLSLKFRSRVGAQQKLSLLLVPRRIRMARRMHFAGQGSDCSRDGGCNPLLLCQRVCVSVLMCVCFAFDVRNHKFIVQGWVGRPSEG